MLSFPALSRRCVIKILMLVVALPLISLGSLQPHPVHAALAPDSLSYLPLLSIPGAPVEQTTVMPSRLAIRTPNLEVYRALKPYQDGTRGRIRFILYAGIDVIEQLKAAGAASGTNPAEFGVLVGCDETADGLRSKLTRFANAGVTYILQDCEKGSDNLWRLPDVPATARSLAPLINSQTRNFRWNIGMQFGYLENTYGANGGDASVCTSRTDPSTCNIPRSYAGLAWANHDSNDVYGIFGQSGSQRTADQFEAANRFWVDWMRRYKPGASWWGISGLVDKNGDGRVDLSPQAEFEIAKRARAMGAQAFAVIWLGRSQAELFGPQTEMDQLLNLWVGAMAAR